MTIELPSINYCDIAAVPVAEQERVVDVFVELLAVGGGEGEIRGRSVGFTVRAPYAVLTCGLLLVMGVLVGMCVGVGVEIEGICMMIVQGVAGDVDGTARFIVTCLDKKESDYVFYCKD